MKISTRSFNFQPFPIVARPAYPSLSHFCVQDLDLLEFSEPGISNYSTLLLSENRDALFVGAREAVFELSKKNVTVRNNKVRWRLKMPWSFVEEKKRGDFKF